jgi:hypothetical protein
MEYNDEIIVEVNVTNENSTNINNTNASLYQSIESYGDTSVIPFCLGMCWCVSTIFGIILVLVIIIQREYAVI